ncbi:MAG TPA: hypothetical protein VG694_02530 [Candidatus Paceibacterota bacterium]|jgi:hypothetical protein|nr:hypothetical protein [Candidatus Paceibacterota bacterium]
MKKMLKANGIPEEQAEQMLAIIGKNPALFGKIAEEVQEKVKAGADQMSASMEVMKKYEEELKKLR